MVPAPGRDDGGGRDLAFRRLGRVRPTPGEGGTDGVGYECKDDDWAGAGPYETIEERWTVTSQRTGKVHKLWSIEKAAYAMGKVEAEQYAYAWGRRHGIDVVSCCPCHVLGPLLAKAHNATWQRCIGLMLQGQSGHDKRPNMLWNIVDVRDVARLHVTALTAPRAEGQRFIAATSEPVEFATTAAILKHAGYSKVSTRKAPTVVLRLMSLFSREARGLLPMLGKKITLDTTSTSEILEWQPTSMEASVMDMAASLSN